MVYLYGTDQDWVYKSGSHTFLGLSHSNLDVCLRETRWILVNWLRARMCVWSHKVKTVQTPECQLDFRKKTKAKRKKKQHWMHARAPALFIYLLFILTSFSFISQEKRACAFISVKQKFLLVSVPFHFMCLKFRLNFHCVANSKEFQFVKRSGLTSKCSIDFGAFGCELKRTKKMEYT